MIEDDLAGIALHLSGVDAANPLGEPELRRLLSAVTGSQDETVYLAFTDALATLAGNPGVSPGFDYRVKGGWVVNLSASAVRSAVSAALMVAALSSIGQSAVNIAVEALAVALPALVDVKRVKLSAADAHLHVKLRDAVHDVGKGAMTAEELYAELTPEVREQLSQLDFTDFLGFLERLAAAGLTERTDGYITVLPTGRERLRITFE